MLLWRDCFPFSVINKFLPGVRVLSMLVIRYGESFKKASNVADIFRERDLQSRSSPQSHREDTLSSLFTSAPHTPYVNHILLHRNYNSYARATVQFFNFPEKYKSRYCCFEANRTTLCRYLRHCPIYLHRTPKPTYSITQPITQRRAAWPRPYKQHGMPNIA